MIALKEIQKNIFFKIIKAILIGHRSDTGRPDSQADSAIASAENSANNSDWTNDWGLDLRYRFGLEPYNGSFYVEPPEETNPFNND